MNAEKLLFFDGNITIDADVCNGKPTIKGQRITVQTILEFLSAGRSSEEILKQYPTLTQEDIQACLAFATQLMGQKYSLQKTAQSMTKYIIDLCLIYPKDDEMTSEVYNYYKETDNSLPLKILFFDLQETNLEIC